MTSTATLICFLSARRHSAHDVFAPMPSSTQQLRVLPKRNRLAERVIVPAPFSHREPRGAGVRYFPGGAGAAQTFMQRTLRSIPLEGGTYKMGAESRVGISFFTETEFAA